MQTIKKVRARKCLLLLRACIKLFVIIADAAGAEMTKAFDTAENPEFSKVTKRAPRQKVQVESVEENLDNGNAASSSKTAIQKKPTAKAIAASKSPAEIELCDAGAEEETTTQKNLPLKISARNLAKATAEVEFSDAGVTSTFSSTDENPEFKKVAKRARSKAVPFNAANIDEIPVSASKAKSSAKNKKASAKITTAASVEENLNNVATAPDAEEPIAGIAAKNLKKPGKAKPKTHSAEEESLSAKAVRELPKTRAAARLIASHLPAESGDIDDIDIRPEMMRMAPKAKRPANLKAVATDTNAYGEGTNVAANPGESSMKANNRKAPQKTKRGAKNVPEEAVNEPEEPLQSAELPTNEAEPIPEANNPKKGPAKSKRAAK